MKISRAALADITRHALVARPFECCGVLLADPADPAIVSASLQADNEAHDHKERNYVLGRAAHLTAVAMEARGEAHLIGYYHSHVWGPAWPSRTDVERAVPGTLYLIVGVNRRAIEFRAFRLDGAEVALEPVEAVEDNRMTQLRRVC